MDWPDCDRCMRPDIRLARMGGRTSCSHTAATTSYRLSLVDSRLTLEDKLGTLITTMSLPGGRADRRVLAACAEAAQAGLSSVPRAEIFRWERPLAG